LPERLETIQTKHSGISTTSTFRVSGAFVRPLQSAVPLCAVQFVEGSAFFFLTGVRG
jgi:hypothetical protein